MKPENLLYDDSFILKIADFGFATMLLGRDGSGYCHTVLGTEAYMAPEIHNRKPYKGEEVDLFAAGIILFILYAGTPPFNAAKINDPYYKLIINNQLEKFWKAHEKFKPKGYFSDEFKDLLSKMFQYDPKNRLSIKEIRNHPWIKGETIPIEEIKDEFRKKREIVEKELEKERLKKIAEKE